MTRRDFHRTGAGLAGLATLPPAVSAQGGPDLAAFDRTLESYRTARRIPGAALGVLKTWRGEPGGRTYFRGYGHADAEGRIPVTSRSLFRIASVSKPITGLAILFLAKEGKLSLDDRLLDHLDPEPLSSAPGRPDARWNRITLRHLLQHTAGWDRDTTFDPMFRSEQISKAADLPGPASAKTIIRYMRGRPLDFDPGSRFAYSNFGYNLLGRVIESITGDSYESWVREQVLSPLGITRMQIGRSLPPERASGEVSYHVDRDQQRASVFPHPPGQVAWPDGGFHLEAMDAHGGWIASVEDLMRFALFFDQPTSLPQFPAELLEEIGRPPRAPVSRDDAGKLKATHYGLGWKVRPLGRRGPNFWHGGSLPGTYTLLVRRWDGFSWVVLFNRRNGSPEHPDSAIDSALHRAADAVTGWDAPATLSFPSA